MSLIELLGRLASALHGLPNLSHVVQNADTSILVLASSLVIVLITVAITLLIPFQSVRVLFLIIFGLTAYTFSKQFHGPNSDFFLNLSTEFFGAVAGIIILSDWLVDQRWAFPFVLVLVLGMLLATGKLLRDENFSMNLRTDFLGAFLVFMLLNRQWLIDSRRERKAQKEYEKFEDEWKWAEEARINHLEAIVARWRQLKGAEWDMQVRIRARNRYELNAKVEELEAILHHVREISNHHQRREGMVYRTLIAATTHCVRSEAPTESLPAVPAKAADAPRSVAYVAARQQALLQLAASLERAAERTRERGAAPDATYSKDYLDGMAMAYANVARAVHQQIKSPAAGKPSRLA
jgi:hypothetical protein